MGGSRENLWSRPVRKRSAPVKTGKAWRNHEAVTEPLGGTRHLSKLDLAREAAGKALEHLDRVAAVAGPILAREGIPPGEWIPDKLMTDLVLSGREMDARWVKRYTEAKSALYHAERALRAAEAEPPPPPSSCQLAPTPARRRGKSPYPKRKGSAGPCMTRVGSAGLTDLPPPPPWHADVPPWEGRER